jgi:hypothetical protein
VNHALLLSDLEGTSDLTEDLALANDHRVDPGRDAKEMLQRTFVVIRVGAIGEILRWNVTELGQEILQVLGSAVEARHNRVDLDAVTRREDRSFENVLAVVELVKGLGQLLFGDGQALEQLDRSGPMINSDDDYRHRGKGIRG